MHGKVGETFVVGEGQRLERAVALAQPDHVERVIVEDLVAAVAVKPRIEKQFGIVGGPGKIGQAIAVEIAQFAVVRGG